MCGTAATGAGLAAATNGCRATGGRYGAAHIGCRVTGCNGDRTGDGSKVTGLAKYGEATSNFLLARQTIMLKTLVAIAFAVAALSACVVYPARPAYYRPAVVVY